MELASEVALAGSLAVAMTPQDSAGNWKQRWDGLQRDAVVVTGNISAPMSGDAIRAARDRLLDFFVRSYHLKDSLISEGVVSRHALEAAISADGELSLLADLANLDKHGRLTKPPRSGAVPMIRQVTGEGPSDGSGWRLVMTIEHGNKSVDGVELAERTIAAWDRVLGSLGLI